MYQPDHFRAHDLPQMRALMRAKPFATLISAGPAGLQATHLPTVLRDDEPDGVIECHLARANPHWKDLAEGNEALLIFHGPEGYITPNWYPSKAEHGKVVPTWNYAVVHAYGRPEMINDKTWLRNHVAALTASRKGARPHRGRCRMHPRPTSKSCCAASWASASPSPGWRASGR